MSVTFSNHVYSATSLFVCKSLRCWVAILHKVLSFAVVE